MCDLFHFLPRFCSIFVLGSFRLYFLTIFCHFETFPIFFEILCRLFFYSLEKESYFVILMYWLYCLLLTVLSKLWYCSFNSFIYMTFFFISVIYGLNPYTFCCRIKYWFIGRLVAILYLSCIESLIVNREQRKLVQKKEFWISCSETFKQSKKQKHQTCMSNRRLLTHF